MSNRIFRSFATVGGWTMASRLLGFVRDMLMARIIGATAIADAFNMAFLLPNLFRRFLAEGAMNNAFLPQYKEMLDDEDKARNFANNVFSSFLLILISLLALVQIFMPVAIFLLASGFVGDERFEMTENFSRITIFYIVFMSLSALCGSILNAIGRFTAAAAAPLLMNVIFIPTLIIIWLKNIEGEAVGYWLSSAVFLSGLAQFLLVYFAAKKAGIAPKWVKPKWNGELKAFFIVLLPALATSGVGQINLVVGRQIASWTEGAVSWLYYADRLIQLPMGVIGIPVGIVLLSLISGQKSEASDKEMQDYYNKAIIFSLLFSLPAAVAIFAIPGPLVQVLFEGGDFTSNDTAATAAALKIYALSIPPLILYRADVQLFYARKDTRTPFYFALLGMIANLALAIGLFKIYGYIAAVIASSVSAWIVFLLAHLGSRKYGESVRVTKETLRKILAILFCSTLMGALTYFLSNAMAEWVDTSGLKWLALLIIVSLAMLFYFLLVFLAIGLRPRQLKAMLRR